MVIDDAEAKRRNRRRPYLRSASQAGRSPVMGTPARALAQHREVLATPGVAWLLASGVAARLPMGMTGIAAALFFSGEGNFAMAGAVTGTFVGGVSVSGPLFAVLARHFARRVLVLLGGTLSAGATLCLAGIGPSAPFQAVLAAFIAGSTLPPISPITRSLWPELVPPRLAGPVYSLDVALVEVTFILGPALVGLLSWTLNPLLTLALSGLPGLAGAIMLACHPSFRTSTRIRPALQRTAWSQPVVRLAMITLGLMSIGFGILEIAVIGQAKHVGQTELVGFVFAFAGIGSLIGGLMLGPAAAARLERALPAMLIVQSVLISIIYSSGSLTSTALWLFGANLFFAPSLGCLYVLIGTSPLVQRKLDVLAWMFSTNIGGIAIGNYVSGLIIHSWSPRLPFLVAGLFTGLAGLNAYVLAKHTNGTKRRNEKAQKCL